MVEVMREVTQGLRIGAPVRHYCHADVVGIVQSYFYEKKVLHYVVEWFSEGWSPNVPAGTVVELPSEMLLLAAV